MFGVEALGGLVNEIVDHIAEIVVVVDRAGTIHWANQRAATELGVTVADWIGQPVFAFVHPDDLVVGLELLVSAQASGTGVKEPVVYRLRCGSGEWLTVEAIATNVELDGRTALVLSARPIKQRRSSEEILSDVSARLSQMFNDAAISMAQIGLDGRLLRVNPAFTDLVDASEEDLVGRALEDLVVAEDWPTASAAITAVIEECRVPGRVSLRLTSDSGRTVFTDVAWSVVHDWHGTPVYVAAQMIDVTELRAAQAELMHRSTHDSLTGLANRSELRSALTAELERAVPLDLPVAVLFVDLDGFKPVNDQHGHAAGDALLVQVAERLCGAVRHDDLVSRIGGDEFVILCRGPADAAAESVGGRVLACFDAPFELPGATVTVGASVGVAVHEHGPSAPDALIEQADAALYQAKRDGRGRLSRQQIAEALAIDATERARP